MHIPVLTGAPHGSLQTALNAVSQGLLPGEGEEDVVIIPVLLSGLKAQRISQVARGHLARER